MTVIYAAAGSALAVKKTLGGQKTASNTDAPWRFGSVVAAVMAFGFYVAAALMADAEFPEFLREHLFDGLAPAALIGFLVDRSLRDDPRKAFPRVHRPVWILVDLFIFSIPIFGSIAAAAVFSSGSTDFIRPVGYCAFFGGFTLPAAYFTAIFRSHDKVSWKWWITKRTSTEDLVERIQITATMPDIKPDDLAEFKQIAAQALQLTKGETGVLQHDWFFSSDKTKCVVRGTYENSDTVLAHMANLGELIEKLAQLGGGLEIEAFGTLSPQLAEAAAARHPIVYEFFQGK
jgi:quinol monooxygenase YgiN